MRIPRWSQETETAEEQLAGRRYHPGSVVLVAGHRLPIGAGNADDVEVRTDSGLIHVLCRNFRMGYAGLETFDAADGSPVGDVFAQSEEQLAELVGPKGLELSAATLIRRLSEYSLCGC